MLTGCRLAENYTEFVQLIEENPEFKNNEQTLGLNQIRESPFFKFNQELLEELIQTKIVDQMQGENQSNRWIGDAFFLATNKKSMGKIIRAINSVDQANIDWSKIHFRDINRLMFRDNILRKVQYNCIIYLVILKMNPKLLNTSSLISTMAQNGKQLLELGQYGENQFKRLIKLLLVNFNERFETAESEEETGEGEQTEG
jgi:hypothetical protein